MSKRIWNSAESKSLTQMENLGKKASKFNEFLLDSNQRVGKSGFKSVTNSVLHILDISAAVFVILTEPRWQPIPQPTQQQAATQQPFDARTGCVCCVGGNTATPPFLIISASWVRKRSQNNSLLCGTSFISVDTNSLTNFSYSKSKMWCRMTEERRHFALQYNSTVDVMCHVHF